MENKMIASSVGLENVEVKLFQNHRDQFAVRLYDLDANETIVVTTYPTLDAARAVYNRLSGEALR